MTLITTHIAVESLVVWTLMGKKNRETFKEKIGIFTLLTLFAAFPDLDTFFFIHRTYFHSIIWPSFLILGVLGYLVYMKFNEKKILGEKANLITRSIIIACIFLILHSILDLNPGPVLLFYPFDNRLYRLNASMVWDLDSIFYIKSLKFSWSSISFNEGIRNSIFNLRPAERVNLFGTEFIELFIGDFPIHFLTFLSWMIFFPGIAIVSLLQKREKPQKFFHKLKKYKNPLLGISILLLTIGLVMGPGLSLNRIETREETATLVFSEKTAYFGVSQSFELDKNDKITLQGIFVGNTSNSLLISMIADNEQYQKFVTNITDLFETYNNNTGYSYSWLVSNYQYIVYAFIDDVNVLKTLSKDNQTEEITYTFNQSKLVYSMILLLDWNTSSDFSTEIKMTNTLFIKRPIEFSFGMIFTSIGITSLITLIIINSTVKKPNDKAKEEIEPKTEKIN